MQRKFQQKVNDMFRQAYGGDPTQGMPFGSTHGHTREENPYNAPRRPRRKIFSRDEGEYIEFEEIHIQADYTTDTRTDSTGPSSSRPAYTPREPQVSDAEWEEL